MRSMVLAAILSAIAIPGFAGQDFKVTPERRALLVEIIEGLGCKVDGVTPPKEFLDAMEKHNFVQDETKAIAVQLLDEQLAVRDGPMLILKKTEKCS